MEQIQRKVKTFILENILFEENEDVLNNNDSFLQKGIIDSTGVLELVRYIEDEFNITVDDEELVPENLDSVDKLARFVKAKSGG